MKNTNKNAREVFGLVALLAGGANVVIAVYGPQQPDRDELAKYARQLVDEGFLTSEITLTTVFAQHVQGLRIDLVDAREPGKTADFARWERKRNRIAGYF